MTATDSFRLGVIEGFFGRPWSWQARHACADFLKHSGFNTYIYAPKNDDLLRKHWQQPYPDSMLQSLQSLSSACRDRDLCFGIGLSPYELYRDFSAQQQSLLKAKIAQLNSIAPDILCVLFDDMSGELQGLAERQTEIMAFIRTHSTARHFMLCPTYYSSDPRLAKLFGTPPENYLQQLGTLLDSEVDILWTGPQVISREYPETHLLEIAAQLQRKPVLWDNYPVNDAQALTDYLHILPFTRRPPVLRELCRGLLANPMNQAFLSQLPLSTLPELLRGAADDRETMFAAACSKLCPPPLAAALLEDAELFQTRGLAAMTAEERQHLRQKYQALDADTPMAGEVAAWLNGDYAFDPACLT